MAKKKSEFMHKFVYCPLIDCLERRIRKEKNMKTEKQKTLSKSATTSTAFFQKNLKRNSSSSDDDDETYEQVYSTIFEVEQPKDVPPQLPPSSTTSTLPPNSSVTPPPSESNQSSFWNRCLIHNVFVWFLIGILLLAAIGVLVMLFEKCATFFQSEDRYQTIILDKKTMSYKFLN